jgi:hypothetical protein
VLTVIAPFLPRTRRKDLALYANAPRGSYGFSRRFGLLFPLLEADGIRYDVMDHFDDALVMKTLAGSRKDQYILYSKVLWKRIPQVLRARHYKAVFIQRNLFPLYPDAKKARLERLARRLCDNITLDFWDPVHLWQPELTFSSFAFADKICMVNEALFDCYATRHPRPRLLPIAVDTSLYVAKADYDLGRPVRLLYTGSRGNVEAHLEPLIPVLEELAREIDLELVVIGKYAPQPAKVNVRHVPWDEHTYYRLLAEADVALFPYFGSPERNRLRVASKTIDYLTTGLPVVGVPGGLPAGIDPQSHLIAVNGDTEWPARLREALGSKELRARVGKAARAFMVESHSLAKSYDLFKRIAFEPSGPPDPGAHRSRPRPAEPPAGR